ncbi:MAG TPA: hypothetical protein VGF45_02690, partial [Polyangia bacterium]
AAIEDGCLHSLRGFHREGPPTTISPGGTGGFASVVSTEQAAEMGTEPQLSGTVGLTSTHHL